jgi:hypothetical protein
VRFGKVLAQGVLEGLKIGKTERAWFETGVIIAHVVLSLGDIVQAWL